ncbi:uncharacterized protein LOC124634425 [Helicoverpa zea]|uniref:uncharacterized protein LOC124634425 n=2 Tax=Helicoverpa zea TaxID=7113 RepID=UPI001F5A0D0F|nr:uncharacterized protein LOC124634425 [Helicoverpa zea]XP_049691685.1 uncharacterized protein LOC126053524 isoform X2 [Helicoverpa armigera]XP_049692689.1 uncharacterized protein LOC126053768 [Helicoverpa armigera]XP_049699040.1 uncharacterized protein LOC126055153 [Helicoverpa armigera]XP_049705872.1 uncharacterized protein LOC126056531 isoform X2 [Helicoverpa armigera]
MGKRKHHDEEEYLARKIRKYEKKMSRVRRKQRSYRSASISSLERDRYSDNEYPGSPQETPQNGGAPYEVNFTLNQTSHSNVSATNSISVPAPTATFAPAPDPTSVVIPVATSTPNIPPPLENAPTEGIQELDLQPDILCLLGEEPVREEKFGVNVHKDIASRWSDILVNGIKDQTKNEILKAYNVPDNLRVAQAPTLNPEIRAAVNESALKRDDILIDKQKILSVVITSLANTITSVLTTTSIDETFKCQMLKCLSDAGRLLCHAHYDETQTRRNFLLSCLNKEIKDSVKDLKRDHMLFGTDLQDNLKSMKAIIKTGSELKSSAAKPKLPPKNLQPKGSTPRALNWRGPPPPQSQPRRAPARPNPTAGGRKQQPSTRRATDRRAPRQQSRPSRR